MHRNMAGRIGRVTITSSVALAAVLVLPLAPSLGATGSDAPPPVTIEASSATDAAGSVFQAGTFDYLVSPDYTGIAQIRTVIQAAAREDVPGSVQGLGTFNDLSGELVIHQGVAYRVGLSGTPQPVPQQRLTPFAQAVAFVPQSNRVVPANTTCAELETIINDMVGTTSGMVAVRVRGVFRDLVTRSVPRQSEPFPPLTDVVANQTVFELGSQRAVLVGFRQGPNLAGLGAPGLHLHGITTDLTAGGHVLSCRVGSVHIAVQQVSDVVVAAGDVNE